MHILHINTEKGWRGGEHQTLLSMKGLRDAGQRVTLLCLKDRPLFSRAKTAGFDVVGVGSQLGALWHLAVSGRHYSVLHAQSSRAFGFAAIATLLVKIPLVYTRRVDFVPRGKLTRWKYRRAAALVAVSAAIVKLLRNAGMGEARVIGDMVAGYECNRERAAAFRQDQDLNGNKVVGVVAALVGHKDPLTMVAAAAAVHARLPDVVFLHFGEGPLRQEVENKCRNIGLESTYRLLGYHEYIEDFFPLFNCFAMSSSEEGLGSSVLDAFYYGVPVAATEAGGLAELVEGRGLLSGVGDADALADNIVTLLTNQHQAAELTATARDYVLKNHGIAVLTEKYMKVYEAVVSSE